MQITKQSFMLVAIFSAAVMLPQITHAEEDSFRAEIRTMHFSQGGAGSLQTSASNLKKEEECLALARFYAGTPESRKGEDIISAAACYKNYKFVAVYVCTNDKCEKIDKTPVSVSEPKP